MGQMGQMNGTSPMGQMGPTDVSNSSSSSNGLQFIVSYRLFMFYMLPASRFFFAYVQKQHQLELQRKLSLHVLSTQIRVWTDKKAKLTTNVGTNS